MRQQKPAPSRCTKPLSLIQDRIVNASVEIRQEPFDEEPAFTPRELIQATLPYKNPGDVPRWMRKNGNYALVIQPGWDTWKDEPIGYPYGAIPRLLIYWLATEAIQKQQRRLEMEGSLADFLRKLGLDPSRGGKRSDAKRLRDQMRRLFRARISFEYSTGDHESWLDMQVAPKGHVLWSELYPEQPTLFDNWIELSEDFYNAITAHAVPLDMRVLQAIKHSPLGLDLYAWASYRAFSAWKTGKPQVIPWKALKAQLGTTYTRDRDFKAKARQHLVEIQQLYPTLRLEEVEDCLVIKPCKPSVSLKPSRRKGLSGYPK